MKCVVLGGGGFIGSHLSEALLAQGHTVRVFDKPEARFLDVARRAGLHVLTGDFLNAAAMGEALSGCEVVYHLISSTVPQTANEDPIHDVETNLVGTLQLLNVSRKAQVKKIIFASSGGTVYGVPQEIPIKETQSTEPISLYGIGKLTIEKYLHLFQVLYNLDYCILRVANAYGERQPATGTQGVISAFLEKAIRFEKVVVWGDGSVIRDYIHVSDIVRALVAAATYEGQPKIFNIGAGQGHSLTDIIGMIEQISGQALQPTYIPGRLFDVPLNVLDISRARDYLKWQPEVGLYEGIRRTYQWMSGELEK
jgi:UDP-glucose 4-epimerase